MCEFLAEQIRFRHELRDFFNLLVNKKPNHLWKTMAFGEIWKPFGQCLEFFFVDFHSCVLQTSLFDYEIRYAYNSGYISPSAIAYCPELYLGEHCNRTEILTYPFF